MFLSKKFIIGIISLTGIFFTILLVIQFIWIKKSVAVTNQQFANKILVVRDQIFKTFKTNNRIATAYVPDNLPMDLFSGNNDATQFDNAVSHLLDSIFKRQEIYLECKLAGRVGTTCYIHHFTPGTTHNLNLDHADYKICLCQNSKFPALDIGFSFPGLNKYVVHDTSWLVFPSFILILLLIALFVFIIIIINKQKSLAELKNDFINNLTHEFNTPLFSIGLTSKILLRSEEISGSPKLKNYIGLITTEKNRLQTQVDKILQLTAIESGSLLMEKEVTDIHSIIDKNVASFRPAVEEKGGTIFYPPEADKHFVYGDKVHLFNAISNLLDNAYKYSDKKPEITISTINAGNSIVITIQDNGIGIPEAAIKMIFDKFYRVKHGNLHDVKGFGLGLSYVKKIVEMHEGTIKVKSKPGEGTIFIISLPYNV